MAHLRATLPHEGVGLLAVEPISAEGDANPVASRRIIATRFYPGTNIDGSATRYTMDPQEVLAAFNDMEERRWQLGAIVHSHPASPATPSPTDLREAAYPDALMVIVSFRGSEPEIRAWKYDPSPDADVAPAPTEVRIEPFQAGENG